MYYFVRKSLINLFLLHIDLFSNRVINTYILNWLQLLWIETTLKNCT
jgi:hypothetical protein